VRGEAQNLVLSRPLGRQVAEPGDADAARETPLDGGPDEIGCQECEREIVMATLRTLQPSRAAIASMLGTAPVVSSFSQHRARAMAVTSLARASARIGRGSSGADDSGSRISRRRFDGGFCQGMQIILAPASGSSDCFAGVGSSDTTN
jgi:hypothetical protein